MGIMYYNKILCPSSKKWILINSANGINILKKYLINITGGKNYIPQQHQVRAIKKFIKSQKGSLIIHSAGSGKTLLAIMCIKESIKRSIVKSAIFVCPKSITKQVLKEIIKYEPTLQDKIEIITYGKFIKKSILPDNSLVVFDEAHRLLSNNQKINNLLS